MNFNSILIGSDDPQRLADYYTKLLGEPAFADDGYSAWQIGTGMLTVGGHSEVHGKNPSPGRLIWNIEEPTSRASSRRFQAAGAIVVKAPYDFDRRLAGCADRDLRGPRRQLLPARVSDGDVAGRTVSAGTPPSR